MSAAIRCRGLQKRYAGRKASVDAVAGIDLEIARGECFGLLGPNGAGKTTTIEIFQGLLAPTAGEVEVLGMRWGESDADLRQRIGTSLQQTKFPDRLTVLEVVRLFRSFYRSGPEPARILALVGLTEKQSARVDRLSGGQQQRLAVACAIAGDPDLLFLDEPTTGLDPQSRRQIWELVRELRNRDKTVLLTTHYIEEAERLCHRVAVIDHGVVIALGTPAELIARLGGEHVIEFTLAGDGDEPRQDEWMEVPTALEARSEAGAIVLVVGEPHLALPGLLELLDSRGRELARLSTRHATLEDVFVKLTGRHLRDETAASA
jgi:ABC-2 type transport system ATP-binding protein